MAKSHRTTISIPQQLKARMDAVDEDINWSAIACRAFEQTLAEIITRKGVKDMKDVVARLRASKNKTSEGRYKEGFEAGTLWARTAAEADELDRLQDLRDRCFRDHEWELQWTSNDRDAFGPSERFVSAIFPENRSDHADARRFWESVDCQALSSDDDFVQGFAEGALDVWSEVRDQL